MQDHDPRDGTFHDDAFGEPVDTLDDRPGPDAKEFAKWMEECFYCVNYDGAPLRPREMLLALPDHLWDYIQTFYG